MPANELQPDDLEVLQAETDGPEPTVRVSVDGPIRTQQLPHKSAGTRTRTIGTTMQKLLSADHRRALFRILSINQSVYVAFNAGGAGDPTTCVIWPANLPLTVTADCELWAASTTATTQLSIITEFWAVGE